MVLRALSCAKNRLTKSRNLLMQAGYSMIGTKFYLPVDLA